MSEDRCYCGACADCREAIERHELAVIRKYPPAFAPMPEIAFVPLLSPEGTGEAPIDGDPLEPDRPLTAYEREQVELWAAYNPRTAKSSQLVRVYARLSAAESELAELRTTVSRLTRERDEAREAIRKLSDAWEPRRG